MRKTVALLVCIVMVIAMLSGCGAQKTESTAQTEKAESKQAPAGETTAVAKAEGIDKNFKGTIVLAFYAKDYLKYLQDLKFEERFKKQYPNVTIELEQSKDDAEYWNSMKIRASANQLPDIMFNKTFTLSRFKEYLVDLTDVQAAKNNMLASGYAVDGKVLGIPEVQGHDYVFYWSDMFEKAGVKVPTTWDDFVKAATTLQSYYMKENPDYMAIALGAKDEWPTYPFMEFMPAVEGNNGQNWNSMAKVDHPFDKDTAIYKAYSKVYKLFSSGAFGKDPNGIGHDQAVSLFAQKKASMFVSGAWALTAIKKGAGSTDTLKTFYLPIRDKESDKFLAATQGDGFMSVTKHSKNIELSKAFVEWYFGADWYPDYLKVHPDDGTMKTASKEKEPILKSCDDIQPGVELVMYDGGGDNYTALQAETKFDYKKLGAEMFAKGFDLDKRMNELNTAWEAARKKLNIK